MADARIYPRGVSREKLCPEIKAALGWPSICAAFLGIRIKLAQDWWVEKPRDPGTGWDLQRLQVLAVTSLDSGLGLPGSESCFWGYMLYG